MRKLFILLAIISAILLSGNAISATYNATGKWFYSTSNVWNNCGDSNYNESGSAEITQNGNNVTVYNINRHITYTGSVNGANYSVSATYSDEGGTTTQTLNFTLISNISGQGNSAWTWAVPGYACNGGFSFTFQKQSGPVVTLKSAGLWSEHRYEADSGIDSYFMLSDATTDSNSHNVYIQNVPNVTGDLLMSYLPGWSGGGTYDYGNTLTSPAPGSIWEKTYTIYIDTDNSGNKTTGDPERSFQINSGTISKMDLVKNVKISGGIHPTISWTGVSRADQYRVRLHPVVNDRPSTDAVYFDYVPSSSGSGSFSYTYNGDLFSQYDTLAIGIEAREIINGRLINRSRYLIKHSAIQENSKAMPWMPLLLLDN